MRRPGGFTLLNTRVGVTEGGLTFPSAVTRAHRELSNAPSRASAPRYRRTRHVKDLEPLHHGTENRTLPSSAVARTFPGGRRKARPLIAFVTAALVLSACTGGGDDETGDRSASVCDGKLRGKAFPTLAGDGGISSQETHDFEPKEWKAAGRCYIYGEKHSVEIDYLFHSDTLEHLDRYKSPGPGTVKTFKVGSATGYLERTKVRVAKGYVHQNRAWLAVPCAIPGDTPRDHAMLEIEVKEPPPARTLDDELTKAFVSALTLATDYLDGQVFKCAATPSAATSGAASPSASDG